MQKQNHAQQLEQTWERAVAQAIEQTVHRDSLSRENLNTAAGLRVQSGVSSGLWGGDYTKSNCGFSCGCG